MPTPTVGSYIGQVDIDGGSIHNIGSTLYGTCATASSTAAKVVVCPGFEELIEGVTIHVKFANGNGVSSPTLNVNSTGAKPISGTGLLSSSYDSWSNNAVVSFTYDGTNWCMNDKNNYDLVRQEKSTTNGNFPILLAGTSGSGWDAQHAKQTDHSNLTPAVYCNPSTGNVGATNFIGKHSGYTLGAACAKAIGSVASGNTGLVTGGDVYTAIQSAAAGSLQYQGTATSDSDIGTSYHAGWYWIVGSAGGTIAGQTVEAGDMILAHANYSGTLADDLDIVQSNVDRITNSDIDTIVAA